MICVWDLAKSTTVVYGLPNPPHCQRAELEDRMMIVDLGWVWEFDVAHCQEVSKCEDDEHIE